MTVLKTPWQRQAVLKTARLILRPPRSGDAGILAYHLSDPRVARMLTHVALPYGRDHAANWIAGMRAEIRKGEARYYVIQRGGAVVGLAGVTGFGESRAELGYWLARPWWGAGLMSEAVGRVVRAAWQRPGLQRLMAVYMTDNEASGRLLLKTGFRYTGLIKLYSRARGRDVMCRTMTLERPHSAAEIPVMAVANPEHSTASRLHPFRQPLI